MGKALTTPVTLVTGFLGSGKTTLVNRVLREFHGQRIAVIENEFGEVGVDADFLITSGEETIIQLTNGCLCCNVRGDLARALGELRDAAREGRFSFERVLIEASGIADPGPVIQTFLAETELRAYFNLDAVVTLVDARHAKHHLLTPENRLQIGYADRVVIGKVDLVDGSELEDVEREIGVLNPRAPLLSCDLHSADLSELFLHIFESMAFEPDFIPLQELDRAMRCGVSGLGTQLAAQHSHGVASSVFLSEAPLDLDRLNLVLDQAVERFAERLWRCKGIIHAANHRPRLVLQGVQALLQISGGTYWRPFERRRTTLVFIGQDLDHGWLESSLRSCEVGYSPCSQA